MTLNNSLQATSIVQPSLARFPQFTTCQAHAPVPNIGSSRRASHVANSRSDVLTRDYSSTGSWQCRPKPAPEPQQEFSGGGGGGKRRVGLGHSRDGGDEDSNGLSMQWNPFEAVIAGVRARAEADPAFTFKLGCECGLDLAIIMIVTLACRREKFLKELDFVLSQCCVSLLCDFALVYLLAPTPAPSAAPASRLGRMVARLPAHVFQAALPGQPKFMLTQRAGCFCLKAAQYGAVGCIMGCIGSFMIHAVTAVRMRMDAAFEPLPREQPIAGTGLGWLCFMGLNSNICYNAVNAAEDIMYARFPGARSKVASMALRLLNKFLGAHAWMAFAKALNLDRPRTCKQHKDQERYMHLQSGSMAVQ